jgi:hypothetical protein
LRTGSPRRGKRLSHPGRLFPAELLASPELIFPFDKGDPPGTPVASSCSETATRQTQIIFAVNGPERKEVRHMYGCVCGYGAETEGDIMSHIIERHLLSYGIELYCPLGPVHCLAGNDAS